GERAEDWGRREVIPAESGALAPEVDGHHHPQLGRLDVVLLVVALYAADDGREKRVVERAADRLGGALQVVQWHVERRQAASEAASTDDRRAGRGPRRKAERHGP